MSKQIVVRISDKLYEWLEKKANQNDGGNISKRVKKILENAKDSCE